MAEDKPGDPMQNVWLVVGILILLVALWWAAGGANKADLRGIFLNPPPPVGSGDAYGPEYGTTTEEFKPVEFIP